MDEQNLSDSQQLISLMQKSKINKLPDSTVRKIKSEQVVNDIVSVVKELIENSLDAGATNVTIDLEESGMKTIVVRDNGSGIPESDLDTFGQMHYTSKIGSFADLEKVQSFGFRGEAIPAICALAEQVEVTTRTADEQKGHHLVLNRVGCVVSNTQKDCPRGTTFLVRNIFNHFPVRREALAKKKATQVKNLVELLHAYMIAYPAAQLELRCPPRPPLKKLPTDSPLAAVRALFSDDIADALRLFQIDQDDIHLDAYFPDPNARDTSKLFRSGSNRTFYYVNKRPVDLPKENKLINKHLRKAFALSSKSYPFLALFITIPSNQYDMNFTANKRKIAFQQADAICEILEKRLFAEHFATEEDLEALMSPKKNIQTQRLYSVNNTDPNNNNYNQNNTNESFDDDDLLMFSENQGSYSERNPDQDTVAVHSVMNFDDDMAIELGGQPSPVLLSEGTASADTETDRLEQALARAPHAPLPRSTGTKQQPLSPEASSSRTGAAPISPSTPARKSQQTLLPGLEPLSQHEGDDSVRIGPLSHRGRMKKHQPIILSNQPTLTDMGVVRTDASGARVDDMPASQGLPTTTGPPSQQGHKATMAKRPAPPPAQEMLIKSDLSFIQTKREKFEKLDSQVQSLLSEEEQRQSAGPSIPVHKVPFSQLACVRVSGLLDGKTHRNQVLCKLGNSFFSLDCKKAAETLNYFSLLEQYNPTMTNVANHELFVYQSELSPEEWKVCLDVAMGVFDGLKQCFRKNGFEIQGIDLRDPENAAIEVVGVTKDFGENYGVVQCKELIAMLCKDSVPTPRAPTDPFLATAASSSSTLSTTTTSSAKTGPSLERKRYLRTSTAEEFLRKKAARHASALVISSVTQATELLQNLNALPPFFYERHAPRLFLSTQNVR